MIVARNFDGTCSSMGEREREVGTVVIFGYDQVWPDPSLAKTKFGQTIVLLLCVCCCCCCCGGVVVLLLLLLLCVVGVVAQTLNPEP